MPETSSAPLPTVTPTTVPTESEQDKKKKRRKRNSNSGAAAVNAAATASAGNVPVVTNTVAASNTPVIQEIIEPVKEVIGTDKKVKEKKNEASKKGKKQSPEPKVKLATVHAYFTSLHSC